MKTTKTKSLGIAPDDAELLAEIIRAFNAADDRERGLLCGYALGLVSQAKTAATNV